MEGHLKTGREALIVEALGDLGLCLDRLEALNSKLPKDAEAAGEIIAGALSEAARRVRDEGRNVSEVVAAEQKSIAAAVRQAAQDVKVSAQLVAEKSERIVFLCLGSGGVGGMLVAAAVLMLK